MSCMICEHPFCSRTISRKCSHHCQLDLCCEHLIEHENLFFAQYEKLFYQSQTSLDDIIIKSQTTLNEDHRFITSLINSTQNFIKKKSQLLNDVKNDQALLYQYDIEQIKLYRTIIQEYQSKEIEIVSSSSSSSSSVRTASISSSSSPLSSISSISSIIDDITDDEGDEDYYRQQSNSITKRRDILNYQGQCPLTHLGVYGLDEKHQLELCSFEDHPSTHYLISHFYNDHHIKWSLAAQLIDAMMKNLDPDKTIILRKDMEIIDKRFHVIRCPLIDLNISKCNKKFYKNSLEKHCSVYHRLSSKTIEKIRRLIHLHGRLSLDDFDENELQIN